MAGRSPGLILQFIPVTFQKANETQNQEQEQEQEHGHRPLRTVRVAQEQEQEQRSEGSVPENRCNMIRRGHPGAGAGAGHRPRQTVRVAGHRPLHTVRVAQEPDQEQETMRQDPGEWRSYPPVLSRVDPRGG